MNVKRYTIRLEDGAYIEFTDEDVKKVEEAVEFRLLLRKLRHLVKALEEEEK